MWCKSRWSSPERAGAVACALLAWAWTQAVQASTQREPVAAVAPGAVAMVEALLPGAQVVGAGTLRYLGLRVYDARLWAPPGWQPNDLGRAPLVLELTYQRRFRGADIAQRSVHEMRRAGPLPPADEAAWLDAMRGIFPDVGPGDRIAGLWMPGTGARFVLHSADGRRRVLGEVGDARFAERFFGIWLAPTSSAPELRQALLGQPSAQAPQ